MHVFNESHKFFRFFFQISFAFNLHKVRNSVNKLTSDFVFVSRKYISLCVQLIISPFMAGRKIKLVTLHFRE